MLVVPTFDLHATVQCPRCTWVHGVGHLLPTTTPIAAVPVNMRASAPSYNALPPAPASPAASPAIATPTPPPAVESAPSRRTPNPAAYAPTPAPYGATTPLPPSSRAADAAGRAISQAVAVGAQGTQQIGSLGQKFLDFADDIDAALYGKRAYVITAVAFLTVVATKYDQSENPNAPIVTTIMTALFSFLLFFLFVARMGSFRDDQGKWSLDLVANRIGNTITSVGEGLSAFFDLSGPQRASALGKSLIAIALVGLALRNVVVLFAIISEELFGATIGEAKSLDASMMSLGVGALIIGTILWVIGWWFVSSSEEAHELLPDESARAELVSAVRDLPFVIDCTDKKRALALAEKSGHPVLEAVIKVLISWQPRGAETEADYQASLHRKLRRDLPGANPERERPIGDRAAGTRGRADLVVSDAVLIEMKKGMTTTSAQRAIGQIRMYLRAWDRGPVMLLVCEADPAMAQRFLGPEIEELRKRQAPVMMVFAGPR